MFSMSLLFVVILNYYLSSHLSMPESQSTTEGVHVFLFCLVMGEFCLVVGSSVWLFFNQVRVF